MFRLLPLLLVLLDLRTINAIYSERCPIVTSVRNSCRSGIFNQCNSNSACAGDRRCCPSTRDGGCALRCLTPLLVEGCPSPLDFALLVDTSGSISRRNFKRLLAFIEDMVDAFDISEDGTHLALVEYSTDASVQMKFNEFSGARINAANYKRKVRKVPHKRGYTYIDKALEKANEEVFTEEGGMRENVTKVALVMTDGKQTVEDNQLPIEILKEAVQPIKDKGVVVMTIGIGSGTSLVDLLAIATSDREVYLAENFEELRNLVTHLTEKKCPVNGGWSEWNDWSVCPVTCGGGTEIKVRTCTNPRPEHGGLPCQGMGEQSRSCNENPCPVDGVWTDWRDWEPCSTTCGGGSQNRSRTCTNPPPAHGGKECTGEGEEFRSCNENPCPVDGNWTEWDEWEACSVTCGGGKQSRLRTCTNPPPKYGGKDCDGRAEEIRSCNEQPCPIDGNWTDWGDWDTCPVTCGGGTQSRSRTCTNPPPAHGGKECTGEEEMFRLCNEDPCPVDGNWTEWDEWEACSVTCGGGKQSRLRTCTNPPPKYGGKDCDGRAEEIRSCNEQPCPIDGNWTDWGDWDTCPVTCGSGTQSRSRTCTNPSPAHGGKECTGEEVMFRLCNEDPCPVDGNWTEWDEWEACSVTCGGGKQSRLRTCTNPPPKYGGKDCDGRAEEIRSCNEQPCPIDGNWTDWGDWDTCSLTCGGGIQSRSRTCTNPPPAHGGKECTGEEEMFRSCNENPCPGDGKWSDWDNWIACSRTCGGGTQSRSRTCTNPPPKHGGKGCDGSAEESRLCNEKPCPIDGNWTEWRAWSPCSVTCGEGIQNRSRTCTNPPPAYGGAQCPGPDAETRLCNDRPCPVDGKWSIWDNWSLCSATCNGGTQDRRRSCTNPPPAHGGAECLGDSEEVRPCNENPCPVNGNWTTWGNWTECTVTCGSGGKQSRFRSCTNPPPAFGGAECPGERKATQACNEHPCPGDGNWSDWKDWSKCTVSCAGGIQRRFRTCTNPPPIHGGRECPGDNAESRSCSEDPCPVDGNWTKWSVWDVCPVSCGGGMQSQSRTCTNPSPAYGGAECAGDSRKVRSCNEDPCPVDGNWSKWKAWASCSLSCGGGTKSRTRECNNPSPAHGGRGCAGESAEIRSCNDIPCPVDGNWTRWSDWTRCTLTCGGGRQDRSRTCTNPPPAHGGRECLGDGVQSRSCNEAPCPVDGNWSPWDIWSRCPVTCGSGEQRRYRTCTNPAPAFNGANCVGQNSQYYICDRGDCPVDGNWAQWNRWSRCTASCGVGTKRRLRSCTNPPPSPGGRPCPGDRMEVNKCTSRLCAVQGRWGKWSSWSKCSPSCGARRSRTMTRKCDNPPPSNGGRRCTGRSRILSYCPFMPCSVSCTIPLDLAILVDTSGSISRRNFKLLLRFIQDIVRGFAISEEGTHVAIIEYSTAATIQLKFNDLEGTRLTESNVIDRVRKIPHQRGKTFINKALELAHREVFIPSAGMRSEVKKVAIVMTDGEQTVTDPNRSANEILEVASKLLKDKGVHIIALGIGKRANKSSLEVIASDGGVYSAANFSELRGVMKQLRKGTCPVHSAGYIGPGK